MNMKWNNLKDLADLEAANRREVFVRDASPSSWLDLGEELRDAAEELWNASANHMRLVATLNEDKEPKSAEKIIGFSRPYLLLAGFAIENVVKGSLVATNPSLIASGSLDKSIKSHNLLALISKLQSIALSSGEQTFCQIASSAIPYWGRYPIPLDSNSVLPEVAVTESLREAFLQLFDRLATDLYWKVRNGWNSGVGSVTVKIRSAKYETINPQEPLF